MKFRKAMALAVAAGMVFSLNTVNVFAEGEATDITLWTYPVIGSNSYLAIVHAQMSASVVEKSFIERERFLVMVSYTLQMVSFTLRSIA